MFLQWKLTFQKTNLKYFVIIGFSIFALVLYVVISGPSCGVDHMLIQNEISNYEKTLDPEMCEEIVEKIDFFNSECSPQIEILDCG